ncbi:MAG: hypothetical protein Q9168_002538 [Polycauliona sp. 1 TL-2023]
MAHADTRQQLMLLFVILTNILLLTSLIAILSQSLTKVRPSATALPPDGSADTLALAGKFMARQLSFDRYSVFVLENLIPLILFRPLRLCVPADQMRVARIAVLKATHLPYVAAIWLYESGHRLWSDKRDAWQSRAGTHKRPLVASHISLSHRATKYLTVQNRSEVSLLAKAPRSGSHGQSAKEPDTAAETKKILDKLDTQAEMMQKLGRQLDELRSMHGM